MVKPFPKSITVTEVSTSKILGDDITFKKLIENSFSGITLLDRDLNTIYRSPSGERITGWNTQGNTKNKVTGLTHPHDLEMVTDVLELVKSSPNIPKTCEFRTLHFQGHFIWIECTFTNMLHEPGINGIVCNFVDVTEKKKAEDLLQQTVEELSTYKYALDESSIIAITDQRGIIQHVNDNFCKISKYSKEELIGQDHRIINSFYHDKAYIKELWATIAKGKIWTGEFKNKSKDGRYYWVDTTIIPFLNDKGKPYQYLSIRFDITSRKEEEHHLKLLESVITNTTDAVLITDAETFDKTGPRIIYINEAFCKMTGYSPGEIIGKTPRIFQGRKSDAAELKRLSRAMRNLQPCEITTINYKKNGEEFWANFSVSPVFDEKGKPTHFISIEKDVTERLNYIKTIENQNKHLKEISWIQSHVIRAPLSRIMGLIPLIETVKDGNELEVMLNYLRLSADELDNVIKKITDKTQKADFDLPA